ncbi:MAG: DUF2946 family protein [Rhizobiales bacterium]|nr:DUF2946 family protein [Hyphomicrobiales bacterium]
MRRWLGTYLPVAMFAILAQLMAPVGAAWAAAALHDPLANAPICVTLHGASDSDINLMDQGQSAPQTHTTCCALCVLVHSGSAAVPAPDAPFVALQLSYQRLLWLADQPMPPARDGGRLAQARAPPFHS